MKNTLVKVCAPDGGYGWIIVFAASLNNFISVPLISNFGLILKDDFHHLGISTTEESFIVNLNSAFGMLAGLVNGPLLNRFGYRKISLAGAFCMSAGIFFLAFAECMTEFVLAYGLMASLGVGLTMSSYTLAISSYFTKKRNRAFGIVMTMAGLGPILMPQIINSLLEHFDTKGVTLILSGIYAQTFIAAILLQPVENHQKKYTYLRKGETILNTEDAQEIGGSDEKDEENEDIKDIPVITHKGIYRSKSQIIANISVFQRKDDSITISHDQEGAGIYGIDSSLIGASVMSLESVMLPSSPRQNTKMKYQWWRSASTINLESSLDLFDEHPYKTNGNHGDKIYNELSVRRENTKICKQILDGIVKIFDLTLFKDPIYCSIMIGLSLVIFAEVDFSITIVYILSDLGMDTQEIAEFLSIQGMADIIFRFLAPFIGNSLNQPPRFILALSLIGIVFSRWLFLSIVQIRYYFAIAVALGLMKGIRTVYSTLIIPSYVPLDRLASASGIQMMFNGLFIFGGGSILGYIRQAGGYMPAIIALNCVTSFVVIMWTIEFFITKIGKTSPSGPENLEMSNSLIDKS